MRRSITLAISKHRKTLRTTGACAMGGICCIARALLQGAPILILDESFAALDPETVRHVHQSVLGHAPTLMVIAHPYGGG